MNNNLIVCSGAIFYSINTQRFLFLLRNKKVPNIWGLVGGATEGKETPWEGLKREIQEEIGLVPNIKKVLPLETFVSNDTVFKFHTYLCVVDDEFIPKLNDEHCGYAWCDFNRWPKPLHQGLKSTLQNKIILNKLKTVFQTITLLDNQ